MRNQHSLAARTPAQLAVQPHNAANGALAAAEGEVLRLARLLIRHDAGTLRRPPRASLLDQLAQAKLNLSWARDRVLDLP